MEVAHAYLPSGTMWWAATGMTSSRCLAAAGVGAASFATCIYAVIDPSGGASKIVQAGHLPPVLVLPDGTTQVLDLPPGLPLGLGAGSFQVTKFSLPRSHPCAVHDGLVESRTGPSTTAWPRSATRSAPRWPSQAAR